MKWKITAGTETSTVEGSPMSEAERLHKLTGIVPKVEKIIEPADDKPNVVTGPTAQLIAMVIGRTPTQPPDITINVVGEITGDPIPGTVIVKETPPGRVDPVGQLRSTLDAQAAEASGFSLEQPLYTRGARVVEAGVENARTSRLEHDALPSAAEAHAELAQKIREERRRNFVVRASNLILREDGKLTTKGKEDKGILLSERSFLQLINRLDIPSGGAYLSNCPPALRAVNVNHWVDQRLRREQLGAEAQPKEVQLRLRGRNGSTEIFAVTGPRYTSYDADVIAQAVSQAAPEGSRGTVHYDGYRARGDVLFHSTVQPEHYVAGEIFRAGVSWSTDDTGGGAIVCRAVLWMNMCLNLIVIDQSEQETVRLRHQGSVDRLAEGFSTGFQSALSKIDHFVQAWDVAAEQPLKEISQVLDGGKVPTVREILIANAVRGMLDRELIMVPGRRENVVQGVLRSWEADESGAGKSLDGMNRAALSNAFTRYAHESGNLDPWQQDRLQADAGQLLYGGGRYARIPILGEKAAA